MDPTECGHKKVGGEQKKYQQTNMLMVGKHTYLHILTVHLDDWCDRGQPWDTWDFLGGLGNIFLTQF